MFIVLAAEEQQIVAAVKPLRRQVDGAVLDRAERVAHVAKAGASDRAVEAPAGKRYAACRREDTSPRRSGRGGHAGRTRKDRGGVVRFGQRQNLGDFETVRQGAWTIEQEHPGKSNSPAGARADHRHARAQHARRGARIGGLRSDQRGSGIHQ